jgi:ankyrin repeat protein
MKSTLIFYNGNKIISFGQAEPSTIYAANADKNTPIHLAAQAGHVSALQFLGEKDPTLLLWRGTQTATPAHLAASHGQLSALQLLADACPATLAARDMRGSTPLHYAALHGRLDVITWVRNDSSYHSQLQRDPRHLSRCSFSSFQLACGSKFPDRRHLSQTLT